MTASEEWTYNVCKNTFFKHFSFANPIGKKGKELCDVIVVCDKTVLVISVKEINIKPSGSYETDLGRWKKLAIEKAKKQLNGAVRFLKSEKKFLIKENHTAIEISKDSRFHKIAVTLGGTGNFSLYDFSENNNYVHFMDNLAFEYLTSELSTLRDFQDYLKEKERCLPNAKISCNGEEDLLAYYLFNNLKTLENTYTVIEEGTFESIKSNKEYLERKEKVASSYFWDSLIFQLSKNQEELKGDNLLDVMAATKIMAMENRTERLLLSNNFKEVIKSNVRSRLFTSKSMNHIIYVFLSSEFEDEKERIQELQLRCFVASYLMNKSAYTVGLSWEKGKRESGIFDIYFQDFSSLEWDESWDEKAEQMREVLGYFKHVKKVSS